MRWDDWLFIIMFLGVVPGLILLLARWISKDSIWATLDDVPRDLQARVDWKSVFLFRLHDFSIKGFVAIALHEGNLLVKPGLVWRLLGLKCKSLKIASRGGINSDGTVSVLVRGKKYRLEIAPSAALSGLLRSGSEQAKCP
jgi:hypothetical protein